MMVWPDSSSGAHAERRIFLRQAASAMPIFSWSALVLARRDVITGSGKTIFSSVIRSGVRIAQRLAGGDVLQADAGGDVARQDLLDLLALVGVHLQMRPMRSFFPDRVVDRVAALEHARIDAHEGQLAHVTGRSSAI